MASTPKFFDRVMVSSTTTGTGTYTLGSAITGFQAFSALGDGNSCYYCAQEVDSNGNPSGGWEVGIGTYATSGTTLTRDTVLKSSNSNSAVSWAAGTRRIFITKAADEILDTPLASCGRLTTETGVPVSTSDRTAKGTIYFTPYLGNLIDLWNGFGWIRYRFSEVSLALTVTSGNNYDVFLYDNAGTLTLEILIWTNDTTRATALVLQDGVLCKTGALTRRYVGTIRASASNVTEDSESKRFVYSWLNQVSRRSKVSYAVSHTYAVNTYRQMDAVATNKFEHVLGQTQMVMVSSFAESLSALNAVAGVAAGLDITNGTSAAESVTDSQVILNRSTSAEAYLETLGYHFWSLNEIAPNGSVTLCPFAGSSISLTTLI